MNTISQSLTNLEIDDIFTTSLKEFSHPHFHLDFPVKAVIFLYF